MKRTRTTPISRLPLRATFAASAVVVSLALGACSTGQSTPIGTSAGPVGAAVPHPDTGLRSQLFLVDPNRRGKGNEVKIAGVFWGRLVDVADVTGVIQQVDFVVGEDIRTNSVYEVSTNPVTEKTTVRIRHLAGTPSYISALQSLDANLTPIQDKSLAPTELPPYSVAPRNSAIVLIFDDLLDARYRGGWRDSVGGNLVDASSGQLNKQVVKLLVDYPPNLPFEARIIVDPNHGDWADYDGDGAPEFHSTRVILDTTVSVVESADSNPPLPVNALGLPGALTIQEPNVVIRIPTRADASVGQTQVLTNPTNHAVAFNSNGSKDQDSVTLDVVRAFRSGGNGDLTGDLNNGFLLDEEKPRVLGNLTVQIIGTPTADPGLEGGFIIPLMVYAVPACATAPAAGDVLVQGPVRALLTGFDSQNGAEIYGVRAQVLTPIDGVLLPGSAQVLSPFNPLTDNPSCFLRFSPGPSQPPATGVSKTARLSLLFSEPMDPASVAPFDTMTITRVEQNPTAFDLVVGNVIPSSDLKEFVFAPSLPFSHILGNPETYYLNLASGNDGPTDLAGNPLEFPLPQVPFALDPNEATGENLGVSFRFGTNDELFGDTFPEIRTGQLLFNLQREVIQPRPVNRFSISADVDKPVPSVMTPFGPGVQTPLSPMGSKLQTLWRYCDLGFSASDETNVNLDVEGLAWTPVGGQVVPDAYDEFSMRLGHSAWLPDEVLNPMTGFPAFPNSGLVKTYNNNFLAPGVDEKIVHPRSRGYVVSPADLFTSQSGKLMIPWPLNRGVPIEQFNYYTWRDTRILGAAGFSTSGVPLTIEVFVLGLPPGSTGSLYPSGSIRTVGLPLLMEFRCYPDSTAQGLNPFEIALAANSSARPNFRAFSTGGFDTNNQPVVRDPDLQTEALGGFNPGSNPPGVPTQGLDNTFYHGQAELLTRVSTVHSVWLDTTFGVPPGPFFAQPVVEPSANLQPSGTQVVLAFRGATLITGTDPGNPPNDIRTNAANLDFYGDPVGSTVGSPVFLNNDATWRSNIEQINGSKFFQFRITFISNPISNRTAEVSALGFAYSK